MSEVENQWWLVDYEAAERKYKEEKEYWRSVGANVRVSHCLVNAGIKSLEDLRGKKEVDLLRLPGFGQKSLRLVRSFLAESGIRLRRRNGGPMSQEIQDEAATALRDHGWTCTPPNSP